MWLGMALGLMAVACGGDSERIAVGTVRVGADCEERQLVFSLESPYGGAESLRRPPEWCGVIGGDMVCFLDRDNVDRTNGVHLARTLSEGPVPADHAELRCWSEELETWDTQWASKKYHPVWDTALGD